MPLKITYIGPLRSPGHDRGDVEIVDSGQWAQAGEPIEVETELAEQLLQQGDNWARANTKAASSVKSQRRRRAASTSAAPPPSETEQEQPTETEDQ